MKSNVSVMVAAVLMAVALVMVAGIASAQQEPGNDRIVEEPSLPDLFPERPNASQGTEGLADKRASIRQQEGLKKKEELGIIEAEVVTVEQRSTEAAIRDLERRSDVEYAQPDHIYETAGYGDEPFFGQLWGLNNTGQAVNNHPAGTPNVDIDALEASATTQGNPGVTVAVMEDVDLSQPDLAARAWVNPGESGTGKETNGIDDDGNGYIDDVNGWNFLNENNRVHTPNAFEDHGTHVAGTVAASLDNQGVVGVAPNVKIMALKIDNSQQGVFESKAIEAIAYAKAKGAKIMQASWGCVGTNSVDAALKQAIEASGGLWVASAMNGGTDGIGDDNDVTPAYPASYDSPDVLSVAALDNQGNLGGFSNYGATSVDISAPGVDVLSTVPAITDDAISGMSLSNVGSSGKALVSGFGAEEISNSAAARASFFTKGSRP